MQVSSRVVSALENARPDLRLEYSDATFISPLIIPMREGTLVHK